MKNKRVNAVQDIKLIVGSAPTQFSIICKNTGVENQYDFRKLSVAFPMITDAFIYAIIGRRNAVGHLSRRSYKTALQQFYGYLETLRGTADEITEISQLSTRTFRSYAAWLKNDGRTSYPTLSSYFSPMKILVSWISLNYPNVQNDIHIEERNFRNADRMRPEKKIYSEREWKSVLQALTNELKKSKTRLENTYVPSWIGESPPLEDVAPINPGCDRRHAHSKWNSLEYCIWFWENLTDSEKIDVRSSPKSGKVRSLARAIISFNRLESWNAHEAKPGISALQRFHTLIGAGENYIPRYANKPCPIKYSKKLDKPEYLHWYWDNFLANEPNTYKVLYSSKHVLFVRAVTRIYGTIHKFQEKIGSLRTVYIKDLFPYYLLFAIRTALNPSTIARITVDCIRPAPQVENPDSSEPTHWQVDWVKIRSFSEGRTIPTSTEHDLMPVSILLRVLNLTAPFRGEQKLIWMSKSTDTLEALSAARRDFVERNNLFEDGIDDELSQIKLSLSIAKIRATVAMNEYVRTENMSYIQTLLGHKSASTTVRYLAQMDNPALILKRSLHQEAMFIDLTKGSISAVEYLRSKGIEHKVAISILSEDGDHESSLAHCKAPTESPQPLQKSGRLCTSNACLSCQNLIVTPYDIYRFYCFKNYHEQLLRWGELTMDQFDLIAGETTFVFTEQIFPKFSPAVIAEEERRATLDPLPEWTPAQSKEEIKWPTTQ